MISKHRILRAEIRVNPYCDDEDIKIFKNGFNKGVEFAEKELESLACEFAEYCGKSHTKAHGLWLPLYSNQTIREDWRTTEQLFKQFIKQRNNGSI